MCSFNEGFSPRPYEAKLRVLVLALNGYFLHIEKPVNIAWFVSDQSYPHSHIVSAILSPFPYTTDDLEEIETMIRGSLIDTFGNLVSEISTIRNGVAVSTGSTRLSWPTIDGEEVISTPPSIDDSKEQTGNISGSIKVYFKIA